jgi:hypothetical protein
MGPKRNTCGKGVVGEVLLQDERRKDIKNKVWNCTRKERRRNVKE